MDKKIVIIGGGIAGLATGCYARMNGYEAEIHEMHSLPGGLCTTWRRGGYLFDGCIHWLVGSSPASDWYGVWEELGVVQGRPMFNHEIFSSFAGRDGKVLHFYTNADRLEAHLKEFAPRDGAAIEKLCAFIRKFGSFSMPVGKPAELMGLFDGLGLIFKLGRFMKDFAELGKLTLGDVGAWFRDDFLRRAVSGSLFDEKMPAFALIATLAQMNVKIAGYPLGGSFELARAMEKRFTDLGGKVHYRSKVEKVIERDGRAVGVRLAGGAESPADYVVCASDLRAALHSLLDGSRVDPLHRELLETGKTYPPSVLVSFGVNMDFGADISCLGTAYELEKPITIAGQSLPLFGIKNYCYDPSLAPEGKSVVGTYLPADWLYWEKLAGDREAYEAEKEKIRAQCEEEIDRRFPGFRSKIEEADVATPLTFQRLTGNWRGTYMTWQLDGDFQRKHPFIPKTVPGLDNFYLASMWTFPPGGIPGAAGVGRGVMQIICRKDKKRFQTTKV
ncbi:MAG: NAD(P)/FAD-dependent oxidoreductase [Spirochaetales bacterium]|nr:NAD(P)/FAD-dependent oxidoreductase [Spirochaetales bacterium]